MRKYIFFVIFSLVSQTGFCAQQRLISLSPAVTEILFALGLKDEIVADTTFCDYPEEAKLLPKIGTFSEPNIEKIVSLKPDIIFTTGLEQAPAILRLKSAGFKVIVSDPKNIPELLESIMEIARAAGREAQAKILLARMRERISGVRSKVEKIPKEKRPKVFIEIWHDPIMTAGPGSLVDELLKLAGVENIAYDAPLAYSRFSVETIIQRDPDIIILGYMTKENDPDPVSERLGWKNIKAVRNKRIIKDINPDIMLRPSPRIVEGLEEIYRHIYNE